MDAKARYDHLMADCLYAWECFSPRYGTMVSRLKDIGRSLGRSDAETLQMLKNRFLTEYDCLDDSFDPEEVDDAWSILQTCRTICS